MLLEHECLVRRTHGALAFEHHKDMIVVFMIVHVVLNTWLAVDDPSVSELGPPQT
jgi:hypothetical protein